jgi:hypothetical protein
MDPFHCTPFQSIITLKQSPRVFAMSFQTPHKKFLSANCNILNLQCIIQTVRPRQYLCSRMRLVYMFSKVRGAFTTLLYTNIDIFIDLLCCLSNVMKPFPSDTCARQWNTLSLEAVRWHWCSPGCWSQDFPQLHPAFHHRSVHVGFVVKYVTSWYGSPAIVCFSNRVSIY